MTGTTHVVLAVATFGVQQYFTGIGLHPWGACMIVIGALAPDIDGQGIIVRPGRWFVLLVGKSIASWLSYPTLALSAAVEAAFGHRGLLHTPFFLGCLAVTAYVMQYEWLTFLSWGYATHIIGDLCTVAGIPLLGPFSWKRFRILGVRNGSFGERAVRMLVVIMAVLWAGRHVIAFAL